MATNEKILRHTPEYIQEGENLVDFDRAVAEELDISLNFLDGTKAQIQISTATGSNLDDIGNLFNLNRIANESDSTYRARILSYISQASSSGTEDDIKNVITNFTGIPTSEIIVEDIGPAKIRVTTTVGTNFELANTIFDIIANSKAAGVYAFLDISASASDSLDLVDSITINVLMGTRIYGLFLYGAEDSKY